MIVEIGDWALREACREAASWPQPLQVSVNLSPVQFRYGDLAGLVHLILLETGLAPGRLELEITEGVIFDDPARALSILRRLKVARRQDRHGRLRHRVRVDVVAAVVPVRQDQDRPQLRHRGGDQPQSAAIVRSIIGLGEALKIPVIAEGVETEGERAFLWHEGCAEIQGFLIGHPLPISGYAAITHGLSDGISPAAKAG